MSRTSLRCRYAGLVAFAEARDCDAHESRRIRPVRQRPSMPGQMSLPFRDDDGGGGGDDGCGRQSGGRFGPRNTCQDTAGGVAATESTVEKLKSQETSIAYTGDDIPAAFKGVESVQFGRLGSPSDTAKIMENLGFTLSQIAGMSPGSTEAGSKVEVNGFAFPGSGKALLQVSSSVSIDSQSPELGSAIIKIDIEKGSDGLPLAPAGPMSGVNFDEDVQSALHLDYFQVDNRSKAIIARSHAIAQKEASQGEDSLSPTEITDLQTGRRVERALGAKIMSLTVKAIEAAEKAGVDGVYAFAAGAGTGTSNLGSSESQAAMTAFRGYSLWGRFGLDGEISSSGNVWSKLRQISQNPDHPDRDILTAESWAKFNNGDGTLMLQDVLETKKGEKLWKEQGTSGTFVLNLKDKESKGYKRYQRMKRLTARARESGQERDFFIWLMDNAESRDYADFFKVERRRDSSIARYASLLAFAEARDCGRQQGGRFTKGNTCAADDGAANVPGSGGSPKEKPLDANDPAAVKAFLEKMQKEFGPKTLEQQRLEAAGRWGGGSESGSSSEPKSLHQQRLEAAGRWDGSDGAKKGRKKQAKFQDTVDRHNSLDLLKSALGSSGINWSQYATQANDHVRRKGGMARKQFHRKAAEAASQGSESLAKFFDDSGLVDLAKKVRAKKNESRNCGTGTGGFQKGNTCAGEKAKEAALGALAGASTGATIAATYTEFYLPAVAGGAGAGAVAGAVKGLYDNAMRPTRVTKAIQRIGSSDERIASLVKDLGGSPQSVASTQGKSIVTLRVKDDKGKNKFNVGITKDLIYIVPSRESGRLTKDEVTSVTKIAKENAGQHVAVVVKDKSPSFLRTLVSLGFGFAVSKLGNVVATLACSACPVVLGTAIESVSGVQLESLGKRR